MTTGVLGSVKTLAGAGFTARTIQSHLAKSGIHYSVRHIYRVCWRHGIHFMDYRTGKSESARVFLRKVEIPKIEIISYKEKRSRKSRVAVLV